MRRRSSGTATAASSLSVAGRRGFRDWYGSVISHEERRPIWHWSARESHSTPAVEHQTRRWHVHDEVRYVRRRRSSLRQPERSPTSA